MHGRDERRYWVNQQGGMRLLHASLRDFAFPLHSHEEYAISLIEAGAQSFTHKGTKHYTPPGGFILINPDTLHTGEPAQEQGFLLRSFYPSIAQLQRVAYELTGKQGVTPYFDTVRVVDDAEMQHSLVSLHEALKHDNDALEVQSRILATLSQLVLRYANLRTSPRPLGNERHAVRQVRDYIDAHFAERITLDRLSELVALSPYYLLRVFRLEVGMPPHAYLQTVRIREAQRLIGQRLSLAEVALAVGFSSQSHMTRRFRPIVGITPGQYATQICK